MVRSDACRVPVLGLGLRRLRQCAGDTSSRTLALPRHHHGARRRDGRRCHPHRHHEAPGVSVHAAATGTPPWATSPPRNPNCATVTSYRSRRENPVSVKAGELQMANRTMTGQRCRTARRYRGRSARRSWCPARRRATVSGSSHRSAARALANARTAVLRSSRRSFVMIR